MADQGKQDALTLLADDHRKVEGLCARFEKASGDGRTMETA